MAEGDLITSLNVWAAWQAAGTKARQWAGSRRINHRALLRAADIHAQLCHHLRRATLPENQTWAEALSLHEAAALILVIRFCQQLWLHRMAWVELTHKARP